MGKKHSLKFVQDYCLKQEIEFLDNFYSGNKYHHNFRCLKCKHEWNTGTFSGIKNQGTGCPACAGNLQLEFEHVKKFCKNKNILYLDDFYNKANENHDVKCLKCGNIWTATYAGIKSKLDACSICDRFTSKGERYILEFIKNNFNNIFTIRAKDRKLVSPYEIDILMNNGTKSVAVEYNGYGHYFPTYGETEETRRKALEQTQKNDKAKLENLKKLNYNFIIIKDLNGFSKKKLNKACEDVKIQINNVLNGQKLDFPYTFEVH